MAGDDARLVDRYEHLRGEVTAAGLARAGLAAALLATRGMAAWMRGWRACVPAPAGPVTARDQCRPAEHSQVVGVLATMALACAGGR